MDANISAIIATVEKARADAVADREGDKAALAAFTAAVWNAMGIAPVASCSCFNGCQCAPEDREARILFWRRRGELLREIFLSEENMNKVGFLGNHISDSGVRFDSAALAGFKLADFQKYLKDNREDAMAARALYARQGSWHEPRDNRASLDARFYDVVERFVKCFA